MTDKIANPATLCQVYNRDRLQHISTCERPAPGWQRVQPPSTEDRTEEQREVDRHLEEQLQEAGTGQ